MEKGNVHIIEVKGSGEIPEQMVDDIFTTAMEGGSNYWIEEVTPKNLPATQYRAKDHHGYPRHWTQMLTQGVEFEIHPTDEEEVFTLNLEKWLKGIEMFVNEHPRKSAYEAMQIIMGDHDAEDADMILQYAIFGEVIYG